MIKRIISLALTLAIVISSVSTVAYAKESTTQKMVVYDGDLVTEEEAKAAEEAKLMASEGGMEYWDKMEKENGYETLTFSSEKELDTYIKENKLLTTAPDIIEDIEVAEKGYVSRNKEIETNEYTLGFIGADGTNTMRVFAFPVKYKDSDGKLKDIR